MKGKGVYEISQDKTTKVNRNGSSNSHQPDPEVVLRAKRRRFSVADKLRILQEADACSEPGQIGALLRREGIYSSYLTEWRHERESGQLQGLTGQKRGRPRDEQAAELARLRQENAHLKAQVAQSLPVSQACAAFGFPRGSLYRSRQPQAVVTKAPRPTPARARALKKAPPCGRC